MVFTHDFAVKKPARAMHSFCSDKEITMRRMMLGVALVSTILGIGVGCGTGIGEDSTGGEEESLGEDESELTSDGGAVGGDAGVTRSDASVGTGDAGWPIWDGGPVDYDGGGIVDAGGVKIVRLSGVWGNDNASLTVSKGIATLVLPCAGGTFRSPQLIANGTNDGGVGRYFLADGTFYPSTAGAVSNGVPAMFEGEVENGLMTLYIYFNGVDGGTNARTLVLRRNVVRAFPRCY